MGRLLPLNVPKATPPLWLVLLVVPGAEPETYLFREQWDAHQKLIQILGSRYGSSDAGAEYAVAGWRSYIVDLPDGGFIGYRELLTQ